MKNFLTTFFSLMLMGITSLNVSAQCTTDVNGQWPGATFTPACSGTAEVISNLCFAGEYSIVNVTSGTMYTFSSNIVTDYLTITNAAASTNYVWGVSPITWTASFTGTIRFWTHTNSACGDSDDFRERRVQCGTPPPPGQCTSATAFGTAAANNSGVTQTITTCAFGGEFSTYTGVVAGNTYSFTATGGAGNFITVRQTNGTGTFVASGLSPLTGVVSPISGTLAVIVHTSAACTTDASCHNIMANCTSCTPPLAPANDNCAGAIPLTVGTSCTFAQYTNAGATASAGVPVPGCASYLGGDVWFSFVVPAGGAIILDSNTGVITDSGMAIYSGTCGSLTLIECDDDDSANGLMSRIERSGLSPGSTVYIRFWEFGGDNNGTFSICAQIPPTPPANDLCANAVEIPCNGSVTGTNVNATSDVVPACPGSSTTARGVWYTVTGTGFATTLSLCSSSTVWDSYISVFTGSCGSFTCVAGDDDGCGGIGLSTVTFNANSGTLYYVLVRGFGATNTGAFTLTHSTAVCNPCRGTDPPRVSALTGTSATILWNSVAGTTGYSYTVGTGLLLCPSSPTVVNTTSTSVNLTGLLPGTDYTVCVRANTCSGGSSPSAWSSFRFTTPGSCETPTQPFVSGLTTTSATLTWPAVAGVTSYKYSRGSSSTCANGTLTTTGSNTVTLTGLTPGTTYYFCVQSDCGSSVSGFVSARFTTNFIGNKPAVIFVSDEMEYSVYPNPANEDINLALNNYPAGKNVSVQIINQLGQTMVSHRFTNESNHVETIRVDQLPDGIYIMSVQTEGVEQKFKKFVKGTLRP